MQKSVSEKVVSNTTTTTSTTTNNNNRLMTRSEKINKNSDIDDPLDTITLTNQMWCFIDDNPKNVNSFKLRRDLSGQCN